jgi:aminoglycoside phosphotransferase (APT) family kinase protein
MHCVVDEPKAERDQVVGAEVAARPSGVAGVAPDDVVSTREAAARATRLPLVIVEPLLEFLDAHQIGSGPLELIPIGEGRSNVIFLIQREGAQAVLRRPPRPPVPPGAHDVVREAKFMSALAGTTERVPKVLAICEDPEVIGAPFYLMEYLDGVVVSQSVPTQFDTLVERRHLGEALIDALVDIHAVHWRATGLGTTARPTGYLERQLARFGQLWQHNKTRELDGVDRVGKWLEKHMPQSPPATVVHGDYRLGNVLFGHAAPASVTAVLDWEMATIGDPLADLGYLATLWVDRDDPPRGMYEIVGLTRAQGFLTRDELLERYAQASGRRVDGIGWYQALALWKSAVLMEGNYRRALAGATDDPFLKGFGNGVVELLSRAEEFAQ